MKNNRIPFFDTARVISMLWIVCIWHLSASMRSFPDLSSPICASITVAALSTFTFISAFFVSGRVTLKKDIVPFYKKRLARFYILYIISCISMVIAKYLSGSENMMTMRQLILSLLGLSAILGPAPITLWFFSMLMFFYIITPFVDLIPQIKRKMVALVLLYGLIAGAIFTFDGDFRVLVFYPSYCLGLLLNEKTKVSFKSGKVFKERRFKEFALLNTVLLVLCIMLYAEHFDSNYWFLYRTPIAIFSITTVLVISNYISVAHVRRIVQFGSYISMCVYLFHSQAFWVAELVFGKMNFVEAYLFVVPLLFYTCWLAQKGYDICFERMIQRRAV